MSIYKNYLDDSLERLRTVLDDSGTRPILFIGSGLARRYYGSPNWIGLLEKLIELNPIISMPLGFFMQNNANDLPKVASSLVEQYQKYGWEHHHDGLFPKELYDHSYAKSIFLKSQVSQYLDGLMEDFRLEDNLHKEELLRLRSLKPHAIITTNYDNLLETIFEDFKVVIGQQVISKKEATNIGHILKIHGSTSHPEEIIISHEDYEQFEDKQKYLIAKLLTYFMEHPIIFLGYAVNDTNIRNILSDISEIVSGGSDEIVNNIWFIEWKKDEIDPDFRPPSDKSIDLGAGKTIRVNYIAVNSFEEVYTSLYQDSAMGIDSLREFQTNIYNIIKSKTITDLEVDYVNVQNITNEETLTKLIGLQERREEVTTPERVQLLGVGTIADPEQLIAFFPMRISDLANKLGFPFWYPVDQAIKKIKEETNYNIKDSNNIYHIDIGIKQPEHRYSKEALDLIRKVLNNQNYTVIVDDLATEVAVTREENN